MDSLLIVLAIPVFLAFILGELWLARRRAASVYRLADSVGNLGNGIGSQVIAALTLPITFGIYALVFARWRFTTLSTHSVTMWIVLFFAVDLLYYWFHRAAHRINLLWAGHVVHHSSEEYNYSVALRQSWFGQPLTEWPFYLPLALAGFPPAAFLLTSTLNTLYQFFVHTRLVGRLGPLEHFMNTPSHHRVHHAVNPRYIDRNYAGVFIIWDKLFGTYEPETDECVYGLVKPIGSFNPLWANLHRWLEIARMSAGAGRLRDKLWAWLAPPEWRPRELGGIVTPPEPDRRGPSFLAAPDRRRDRRVLLGFALVFVAATGFIYAAGAHLAAPAVIIAAAVVILAGVVSCGAAFARAR